MPSIEDSGNLSGIMEAQVVKNVDPKGEGRIAVFIPKIMFENDYDEDPWDEEHEKLNEDSFTSGYQTTILNYPEDFAGSPSIRQTKVRKVNYIWARSTSFFDEFTSNKGNEYNSGSYRIPREGASVFVIFLDEDPQKCYYLPISPTKEGNMLTYPENSGVDETWNDIESRPYMDVIRSYYSGMRIEANNKEHTIIIQNNKGDKLLFSPRGIDVIGDLTVYGNLRVYDKTALPKKIYTKDEKSGTITINFPTQHSAFEVLTPSTTNFEIPITRINGIGYVYDEIDDIDNIIPAMREIEEYIDSKDDDETSEQELPDVTEK